MAAPMGSRCRLTFEQILRKYAKINHNSRSSIYTTCHLLSNTGNTTSSNGVGKDPEELFLLPEVQKRLYKIAGFDINKVFRPRQMRTNDPKYKLYTDEQLQEVQEDAIQRGLERLQMPPYMKAKEDQEIILSEDPLIEGYDTSKYVTTDITFGIPDRSRLIVVREPTGTLRQAYADERHRMYEVFNPVQGRMMFMPAMFEEENLEKVLDEERYEYVLDRACLQFEPDDPDFVRVCHRTYESIAAANQFEMLRSTRHFGTMAFYFAFYKRIDRLLTYLINTDQIEEAADLVSIFQIIHPESKSGALCREKNITETTEIIKTYASSGDGDNSAIVELAIQAYVDHHSQQAQN